MENATKAMLIAAGMLMGVMILSLGVTLFNEMSSYVQTSQETIRFNDLNAFNTQFLKYANSTDLTIHDVVTVANLANQNNKSYNILTDAQIFNSRNNPSIFYVSVYLDLDDGAGPEPIEANIQDNMAKLLSDNFENTFRCSEFLISETTERVYKISFVKM